MLIGCEFSGTVRAAFTALGHDAWSCDFLPTERPGLHFQGDVRLLLDGWMPVRFAAECDPEGEGICRLSGMDVGECLCPSPTQDEEMEYCEQVGILFARPIASPHWDLAIFHPSCTYLTSAAEWAYRDGPYHQRVKPETLVGAARRAAREEAIAFVRELLDSTIPRVAVENPIGVLSSRLRKPDQTIHPWQFGEDASKATCLWLKGLPLLAPTNVLPGGRAARRANQTASGQNKLTPGDNRWKLRSKTYDGIALAMAQQWGKEPR